MFIRIHIRYLRSSLAIVISFVVRRIKRSPGTKFAAEDMTKNIRTIFVYIAANFRISNRIAGKVSKFRIRIEYYSVP